MRRVHILRRWHTTFTCLNKIDLQLHNLGPLLWVTILRFVLISKFIYDIWKKRSIALITVQWKLWSACKPIDRYPAKSSTHTKHTNTQNSNIGCSHITFMLLTEWQGRVSSIDTCRPTQTEHHKHTDISTELQKLTVCCQTDGKQIYTRERATRNSEKPLDQARSSASSREVVRVSSQLWSFDVWI